MKQRPVPVQVGSDTADRSAALHPSVIHGHGAAEFERFREGAARRDEMTLVILPMGNTVGHSGPAPQCA